MNNWSKFLSLIILFDNKRTKNDQAISFSARQKQCFLIWMLLSGVAGNILIYYKSVVKLSQACLGIEMIKTRSAVYNQRFFPRLLWYSLKTMQLLYITYRLCKRKLSLFIASEIKNLFISR